MGRRERRRREALVAALVASALPVVWRYALALLDDEDAAREVVRAVFTSLDPVLLAEEGDGLARLLLLRTRRAIHDRGGPAPGAPAPPAAPGHAAPPEAGAVPPGAGPVRGGVRATLARELPALEPGAREAVVLRDVLRLAPDDAATVCDGSVAEVRERRHRGHRRLVAALLGAGA